MFKEHVYIYRSCVIITKEMYATFSMLSLLTMLEKFVYESFLGLDVT